MTWSATSRRSGAAKLSNPVNIGIGTKGETTRPLRSAPRPLTA